MNEITNAYKKAQRVQFDDASKFVIMSDMHRGTGGKSDDFLKNKALFLDALTQYYKDKFTYVELGDGEELWENHGINSIINTYLDIYLLFKKFHRKKRLYLICGNHDKAKQCERPSMENLCRYYDEKSKEYKQLLKGAKTHEALVLQHTDFAGDILLLHGHQADFFNNKLWRVTRFLSRNLWKHLEHLGLQDPTKTAEVYKKKMAVEKRLTEWALDNKQMIIAGHTHKAMFSDFDVPAYFNDGSCVSTGGITAIEIEKGKISLVRWMHKTKEKNKKTAERETIAGSVEIRKYFQIGAEENITDVI